MEVYIVQSDVYDIDSSYASIEGAFDSEIKAYEFIDKLKEPIVKRKEQLCVCQKCALLKYIDDYIGACQVLNLPILEHKIDLKIAEFKENAKCNCQIQLLRDSGDQSIYDAYCTTYSDLQITCQESIYFKVIPMELQ